MFKAGNPICDGELTGKPSAKMTGETTTPLSKKETKQTP
jgi:hypothetical protein